MLYTYSYYFEDMSKVNCSLFREYKGKNRWYFGRQKLEALRELYRQNKRRHSEMDEDVFVADVLESTGLKFKVDFHSAFFSPNLLNEMPIDARR